MKAIILAAGYATRLYPLTKDQPKALLPIAGRAILDYLMDNLARAEEINEAHIVSNHKFYTHFCSWAEQNQARYPRIALKVWDDGTMSNDTRLGAIGDIWFAIEHAKIDDDIIVAASDNLLDQSLDGYFADFRAHGRDLLLAGRIEDYQERKRYAIAKLDENGRILHLTEKPSEPESDIAIFAEYIYRRDTLPMIGEYLAAGLNPDAPGHFPEWLYTHRDVRAYVYPGECVDVGTLDMYNETCAKWANKA